MNAPRSLWAPSWPVISHWWWIKPTFFYLQRIRSLFLALLEEDTAAFIHVSHHLQAGLIASTLTPTRVFTMRLKLVLTITIHLLHQKSPTCRTLQLPTISYSYLACARDLLLVSPTEGHTGCSQRLQRMELSQVSPRGTLSSCFLAP